MNPLAMLIARRKFETVHHQSTGSIRLCYLNQVSSHFNLIQSPPPPDPSLPLSLALSLVLREGKLHREQQYEMILAASSDKLLQSLSFSAA